jgi:hypothetical protein
MAANIKNIDQAESSSFIATKRSKTVLHEPESCSQIASISLMLTKIVIYGYLTLHFLASLVAIGIEPQTQIGVRIFYYNAVATMYISMVTNFKKLALGTRFWNSLLELRWLCPTNAHAN